VSKIFNITEAQHLLVGVRVPGYEASRRIATRDDLSGGL